MEEENYTIPTLEEALNSIAKLKKAVWPEYIKSEPIKEYIDKWKKEYFKYCTIFPQSYKSIPTTDFKLSFFRARPFSEIRNYSLRNEYSYPPSSFTKMGRCNFPGYPVFYSSINPIISLYESVKGKELHLRFCLSKWKVRPDLDRNINISEFIPPDLPETNLYFNLLKDKKSNFMTADALKKLSEDQRKGYYELMNYFNSVFVEDNTYSISALLSHYVLFQYIQYNSDVIIYPSIASGQVGVNAAFHPNFVDENMYLDKIFIMEVNGYTSNSVNCSLIQHATTNNSRILWHDPPLSEEESKNILKDDFGYLFDEI